MSKFEDKFPFGKPSSNPPGWNEPGESIVITTMRSWLQGEPVWPYQKILDTWGTGFENYRVRWARELEEKLKEARETGQVTFTRPGDAEFEARAIRAVENYRIRDFYIVEFGFAIPCAELLDELAKHEHVVEVGAGSGYMTRLMMHRGINVTGSNPHRPDDYSFEHGRYADLDQRDAKTMARAYPQATIFCSWPSLHKTWFRQMLRAMRIGQKLVVIREDACAEESAWRYLDGCFETLDEIDIPTFEHMNDYAGVYVKKHKRLTYQPEDAF